MSKEISILDALVVQTELPPKRSQLPLDTTGEMGIWLAQTSEGELSWGQGHSAYSDTKQFTGTTEGRTK